MKNKWNKMNVTDKTMIVVRIILSVIVILLALLQLLGVIERAIHYAVPLLGIYLLILSIQEWKKHRGQAILSICIASFILIVSFIVWFGK